jgi:hypothetical protein
VKLTDKLPWFATAKRKPSVDFGGYWQRHETKEAAN